MRVLSIGEKFPEFSKTAVVSTDLKDAFTTVTHEDHIKAGKWMVMFWWPKDFTFVCPTEIVSFNNHYEDFEKLNAMLIGASTDSEFVHLAWRQHEPKLRNLKFPMLADTSKSLAEELGILEANEKIAYRATFIVDPKGIIRWVCVNDLSTGRNVAEVVRMLNALQVADRGELVPCDWEPGQETIKL